MAQNVKPIPDGYQTATPYLIVNNAAQAIEFYKKALGAVEVVRLENNGKIMHAEIRIGTSVLMLADECPEMHALSPKTIGGSPISIMLYVDAVDDVVGRAVAQGATLTRPVADMFYGDRSGGIEDPFGHKWFIATHIEDVPPAELEKRAAAMHKERAAAATK